MFRKVKNVKVEGGNTLRKEESAGCLSPCAAPRPGIFREGGPGAQLLRPKIHFFREEQETYYYLCSTNGRPTIVTFDKDYLRELYENGKGDKKHRFQPEVIRKYQICIRYLLGASNIRALFTVHSLHYDVLSGDKAGISSIRVNKQYRIEFTVAEQGTETIVTVCNILELSNHYK